MWQCQYYSLPEFSLLESNCDIFSLMNYNIRSFHANGSIFETMLDSLEHSFKCIVVSETWNNENNVELCKLLGYKGFHKF